MRIKTFSKFIENTELQRYTLNDTTVVIDGQNFLYNEYKNSKLPYAFGCESDRYAQYLREHLGIFKKANIKCIFIFKGGHEEIEKCFRNREKNERSDDIVPPIFMKDVYKQVLEEMSFDYVICEFESKRDCIAYSQKHNCPLISFDIEYCFAGVLYIPFNTLKFDKLNNKIRCGLFSLDNFIKKYRLTEEKIAIFIVLTDQLIFPENHFLNVIKSLKLKIPNYKRNVDLLHWLSKVNAEQALDYIFKYINSEDKKKFLEAKIKVKDMIRREETGGVAMDYLENGNDVQIMCDDPKWFEKGVASKQIAIMYVNLYHSNTVLGSWFIKYKDLDDPLLFSLEIIKYAKDLLTNFQNDGFKVVSVDSTIQVTGESSVQKPCYVANNCVFENGWGEIRSLRLFEHFLIETLQEFDFQLVEKLPEDSRLLFIALVYFSRKKSEDTNKEVYSILFSYIMLGVVLEKYDKTIDISDNIFPNKPILDSTVDKNSVIVNDCNIAVTITREYFKVSDIETEVILDLKTIHPLVQFEHCLQQLNYLNKLCGSPYKPTIYSKTYNGTFVYKVLYAMKKDNVNGLDFIKDTLSPAATVLALLNGFIESYEEIMY